MEFNEKLQELRKQKGMTQDELAKELYVSRTAISKWESGRGYPNIESLKAVARYFNISVDELLSSDEVLTIAEKDGKRMESYYKDMVFGLSDLCMSLLFFLPLFAVRGAESVIPSSLLNLGDTALYLKLSYFFVVTASVLIGILILALQSCSASLWRRMKFKISLTVGFVAALLFIISSQPYAAVMALSLLIIKAIILAKHR